MLLEYLEKNKIKFKVWEGEIKWVLGGEEVGNQW